jgi:hypothetical protein
LPRNFTKIKHLAQALFWVVWLNLLWASAGKDRETWRVCGAGMKRIGNPI